MNKEEFIAYIADRNKCTKKAAEDAINMFTSSVTAALEEEKEVLLIGFGRFHSVHRSKRKGTNPKTKKAITIPARESPRFTAGQKLKDAVNKK
jgi:nucleoid DNA-binding protein